MVLTLPLCLALKRCCPNSEIVLIANSYTAPLIENSPAFDRAVFIDSLPDFQSFLEKEKIGVAFFPRPRFKEALAAFKARVPLRVGSAYRAYSVLFNKMIRDHRKNARYHEAEYNVRMLSAVSGTNHSVELVEPVINPKAKESLLGKLELYNVPPNFIVVHPGSGGSAFEFPAERFGEAASEISNSRAIGIVITGASNEADKCQKTADACPEAINLCGKLNLREFFALLSLSKMTISNSTGALHVAAALGKPVVGLYPNSPHLSANRWGPYTSNSRVISPPKWDKNNIDNMTLIRVEDVVAAALELLPKK